MTMGERRRSRISRLTKTRKRGQGRKDGLTFVGVGQPDLTLSTTVDGSDEKVAIRHTVEALLRPDGKAEQVYDFLEYRFPGVVGAAELTGRAHWWSPREVHITGAGLDAKSEARRFIIDYFRRRLFAKIHYLSPDRTKNDPIRGYKVIWKAKGFG
jgi:hypothetical protein